MCFIVSVFALESNAMTHARTDTYDSDFDVMGSISHEINALHT